jgi:O-antigen ligase
MFLARIQALLVAFALFATALIFLIKPSGPSSINKNWTSGTRLTHENIFWLGLVFTSVFSPIAYRVEALELQRIFQFLGLICLVLKLALDKSIRKVKSGHFINSIFLVFLSYFYFRTLYANQNLTLSVVFVPLLLICVATKQVSFSFGKGFLLNVYSSVLLASFAYQPDIFLESIKQANWFSGGPDRFGGLYQSEHEFGFIASLVTILALNQKKGPRKISYFLLGATSVLISGSRGAQISLILSFVLLFALKSGRRFKISMLFILPVAYLTLIKNIISTVVADNSTLTGRTVAWPRYVAYFKENFWLGGGAGVDRSLIYEKALVSSVFNTPHNGFLAALVYGGLIGFILLAGFHVVAIHFGFMKRNFDPVLFLLTVFLPISYFTETRLTFVNVDSTTAVYVLIIVGIFSINHFNRVEFKNEV